MEDHRRGSSALRLGIIIDVDGGTMNGRFFKVIHAEQQTFDVVCVRENGSLACSCGEFATFGAPDRDIFSVFRHGFFAFDSILNLHPIYLHPSAVSLDPKEVLNQS